jgi:TfoX/Sxy family transcriptional regulator of competence genes
VHFTKTPKALFDFIDFATKDFYCESRKMFGGLAYFVNGNMFTGVHQSVMFLRLSAADQTSIMKEFDEVAPFEPLPGRAMREYVAIPESVFSDAGMVHAWLTKSYTYVSSLPAKQKKGVKKKTK